jgi:hypothetical protein
MMQLRVGKFTEVALNHALEIERRKKHVSLLVRNGVVESVGINQFKTHPLAKKYGYRYDEVHSELDALIRYKGPKDGLSLFNFRFNRYGEMRMSKPCCLCAPWCSAIFDEIFYTTDKGIVRFK